MSESTEQTRAKAAKAKFIQPIMAVLPAPKTSNVTAFIDSYANVLAEFPDEVLDRAKGNFLRTMRAKAMPAPGECFDLCREAAVQIETERRRKARVKPQIPEQFVWTPEQAHHADRLFASAWGRKAVADGVPVALWDFLVKQQRWPNQTEYDRVKAQSLRLQAEMDGYLRIQKENGGIKPMAKSWLKDLKWQSDRLMEIAKSGVKANGIH